MALDFQRIQGVFQALADLPPAERTAVLERECAGDAELRRRVEALLKAHDDAGELPAAQPEPTGAYGPAIQPGQVFAGRYKLREKLGEGGMGVVFVADQIEPVKRRVALKIIRAGLDTHHLLARFEQERQALALMDHPNIAKVFDAGVDPAQRPYFAMELVKGLPLTKYCDDARLSPRQRLELFIPVCQAVQHAHQKGIIHRDLKPSNILVGLYDDRPVPKVIDFGVAKATGPRLTEQSLYTEIGCIIGTLEYMSPEQAQLNNLDIDSRSDIYALGVLLYELLTGAVPFSRKELEKAGLAEMLRIIKEVEPAKPSTKLSHSGTLPSVAAQRQTEPRKLTAQMRGELDWIVMKALEKDRNRRYETASAFAADVQRYLHDEPVLACPPSPWYRLRKFARRQKLPLLSAAVVLVLILLLGGRVGWTIRDRAERDRAVKEKVTNILKKADELHNQGKWQEALAVAEQAKAALTSGASDEMHTRVDNLLKELHLLQQLTVIRMQWADAPHESEDRTYMRLFADFGIDVDRLSPGEIAARIGHYPNSAVWLAAALDDWAVLRRDYGLTHPQKAVVWQRLLEAARLVDPDPWRKQLRHLMGREDRNDLGQLADSSDMTALPPQSLRLMGQALAINGDRLGLIAWLRKAHRRYPGDVLISLDLCFHLSKLPSPPWAEILQFAEAALAAKPDSAAMHDLVGSCLSKLDRQEEAIAAYANAIELDPKDAKAHSALGEVHARKGQWKEAAASLLPGPLRDVAFVYACLLLIRGDNEGYNRYCQCMFQRAGETKDSYEAFVLARGCAIARKPPVDPARVVRWANQAAAQRNPWDFHVLGLAQYRAGQFDQALQSFTEANAKTWIAGDLNCFGLALVHHRLGHPDEARGYLDKGIQWLEREGPTSPERTTKLQPQDWLEAQLLRHEAEEVLKTKPSP